MYQKLFAIFFLIILSEILLACSCWPTPMSLAKINKYDLVFKGKIINKEIVSYKEILQDSTHQLLLDYFKYTFEVTEEIKPLLDSKQLVVYSITQGSACGVNYDLNDEYYIFSYEQEGNNFTDLCTANKKAKEAKRKFKKVVCEYKNPKDRKKPRNKSK